MEMLFEKWAPRTEKETVAVADALGRVLVRDAHSQVSIPVVRASAMDGVAVQAARFQNGAPDTSDWKIGEDFCRADTGDDFDDRFDAVIPIEKVTLTASNELTIQPDVEVKPGLNVRPQGSTIREGDLLAKGDRTLRSFDLACLAAGGVTQVEVYRRPRVAFLPTGNELVPLGAQVQRGNNIDSNSILVKNMLLEMGAEPICLPIVPDERSAAEAALDKALELADVVLINGGSSKGEEDFNARMLEQRGVALFHGVAAAPGRPMCVGLIDNKPVINVPGPPLAVLYSMDWCVRAIVNRLLHKPMPERQTIQGVLTEDLHAPGFMEILCMMEVTKTQEGYQVRPRSARGGNTAEALGAGALYITKLGSHGHRAGETIQVELLRGAEEL
jgi:molybdopterin molybdotransferase/putative molybdopterin biosynthesis protein